MTASKFIEARITMAWSGCLGHSICQSRRSSHGVIAADFNPNPVVLTTEISKAEIAFAVTDRKEM
jgi:hypothetical protein